MLADIMKTYRKKSRMTQSDIAEKTGIPQTTISRWENSQGEPTLSDAYKLATALNVTVNDLLEDTEPELSKTG